MKKILTELFLSIVVVVLVMMGIMSLRDSIAAGIEEIGIVWQDRKLTKRIMRKIKGTRSEVLRTRAMDILLMDVSLLTEWLETKSLLTEDQKRHQLLQCHETLLTKRTHYSILFRDMSDKEIMKLVRAHVSEHDSSWRRRLLRRLQA